MNNFTRIAAGLTAAAILGIMPAGAEEAVAVSEPVAVCVTQAPVKTEAPEKTEPAEPAQTEAAEQAEPVRTETAEQAEPVKTEAAEQAEPEKAETAEQAEPEKELPEETVPEQELPEADETEAEETEDEIEDAAEGEPAVEETEESTDAESITGIRLYVQDEHSAYAQGSRIRLMTELKGEAAGSVCYAWQIRCADDSGWRDIPTETGAGMELVMAQEYDGAMIRAAAIDTLDGEVIAEAVSEPVTLALAEAATPELPAPDFSVSISFVNPPKHLFAGRELTIASELDGIVYAPEYQWQILNGGAWDDIPGATDADYTFTLAEDMSGVSFRVVVTDSRPEEAAEENED